MGRNGWPWRLLEVLVNGADQIASKRKKKPEGKERAASSRLVREAAVGSVCGRG